MHLVQILLPRADNTGCGFPREDFERVKQELASRFKGVTAAMLLFLDPMQTRDQPYPILVNGTVPIDDGCCKSNSGD
jgi:hypothetical protein